MTGLVQLYQRLSARATRYFLSADRSSVTHSVRTEITVEHERRVWLLQEERQDTTAGAGEPGAAPAESARHDVKSTLPISPSSKPHLEGESR